MNLSKSLFLTNSIVFRIRGDGFIYKVADEKKVYDTKHNLNGNIEYTMASYTSYSPGKNAFYFVSNNDIGVIATLKSVTNKTRIKALIKQQSGDIKHFYALFE